MSGKLSVVATPIGNLADITFRAVEVLKEADYVLAEDTRVTKKLLSHYDIKTPLKSYHQHSDSQKTEAILDLLEDGKHLALVTDAGTPGVSDPGGKLVSEVRKSSAEITIESIPGPSSVTAALSISGMPADEFIFLGFAPHKKGRETFFKDIGGHQMTVVFYESTHRIGKALFSLAELFGDSRQVVVAKELTKMHEEVFSGTAREAQTYFEEHPEKERGEFVVMVGKRVY